LKVRGYLTAHADVQSLVTPAALGRARSYAGLRRPGI
jgi:hypothetical protein